MNIPFLRKALHVIFYCVLFIFIRDLIYEILIRFYESWSSSFIYAPTILLFILLFIKFLKKRFNFKPLILKKVDFFLCIRLFLLSISLYTFSLFFYPLVLGNHFQYNEESTNKLTLMSFYAISIASIFEELYFRGFLLDYGLERQDHLESGKSFSTLYFCILTSILFSLSHLRFDMFIMQYFIFSMISSFIFIKSKNIWYCIFFHFSYNLLVISSLSQILEIENLNVQNLLITIAFLVLIIVFQVLNLS